MDDQIRSESSFFWRLSIQPTVFTVPFCESVKRSFHFEPKSSDKAPHLWQCDIIEDMINGVATMAIDIHRANFEISSASPPPTGPVAVTGLSQRSRSEVLEQPLQLEQEDQEYSPGISKDVEYRTISIHTPKYLSPLMWAFLRGCSTDSIRVEVDASEVLHEGKYVIVLALSEEKSISQITSPSSYLWIMDSIYHDILPTVQPDPGSADVWFEFPNEALPPDQQKLPRSGGDGSVVTIGAHWCVLSKYESLVRWIEHERQVEQEQQRQEEERVRREQHEAEMRFLYQQRMQQETMRQQEMQRLHEMHRRQYPPQQAQMHVVEPAQMYHHPPPPTQTGPPMGATPVPMPMSMSMLPPPIQGQQYFCDPYNPHFLQQAPAMLFQSLPHQPPLQRQPYYHAPFSGLQDPMYPKSHPPYQPQLPPPWPQLPQMQEAPVPPHKPSSESSPTLRSRTHNSIRVKQFSSSTFRVLLQYLYTGQIGLTGEQQRKLEKHWWLDRSPTRNNDNGQERQWEEEGSVEVLEQGRVHLPVLQSPTTSTFSLEPQLLHPTISGATSRDESKKSLGPICLPPLEPIAHRSDGDDGPSQFARMLARMMTLDTPSNDDSTSTLHWLPCSRRLVATDGQHVRGGSLDMLDPTHSSSSCTWESLMHVSRVLGLQDLHGRATKALGYHCQMLVVRTFMHNAVTGVMHNGFDETQLDLQLAMNKDLLEAFLQLYGKKGVTEEEKNEEEEGVRFGRGMVVPVERGGGAGQYQEEMKREDDEKESATASGLLDGAECQDLILGLCKDIRSLFLDLQDNMAT